MPMEHLLHTPPGTNEATNLGGFDSHTRTQGLGFRGLGVQGFFPSYLARKKPALQGLGFRGLGSVPSCFARTRPLQGTNLGGLELRVWTCSSNFSVRHCGFYCRRVSQCPSAQTCVCVYIYMYTLYIHIDTHKNHVRMIVLASWRITNMTPPTARPPPR